MMAHSNYIMRITTETAGTFLLVTTNLKFENFWLHKPAIITTSCDFFSSEFIPQFDTKLIP